MRISLMTNTAISIAGFIAVTGFKSAAAPEARLLAPYKFFRTTTSTRSLSLRCWIEDASNVDSIEAKTVAELKKIYRKLGGTPGVLRKQELLNRISPLLNSSSVQSRSKSNKASHSPSSGAVGGKTAVTEPTLSDPYRAYLAASNIAFKKDPSSPTKTIQEERKIAQKEWSKLKPRSQQQSGRYTRMPRAANRYKIGKSKNGKEPDADEELWLIKASCNHEQCIHHPMLEPREARPERIPASDLDLLFLGTASCIPSVNRGVSSIALRSNGEVWIFDVGEATQIQIQKSFIRPSKITKIFLTHLHGDHINGLPGLICLMGQIPRDEYPNPVDIYGPKGTRLYIRAALRCTYSRVAVPHVVHEMHNLPFLHGDYMPPPPPFNLQLDRDSMYGEVEEGSNIMPDEKTGLWHLFNCKDTYRSVVAGPMKHTIPCVGYVVAEEDTSGALLIDEFIDRINSNAEAIRKEYNFRDHRRLLSIIKSNYSPGGTFKLPGDGSVLEYDKIMTPMKRGRKVVILGDTCDASSLEEASMDADVVVHEATNTCLIPFDACKYEVLELDTISHGHSTPHMAGRFAEKVRARQLLLTHFSSRYHADNRPSCLAMMERISRQAARAGNLKRHQVLTAFDFMHVSVPNEEGWVCYEENERSAMKDIEQRIRRWKMEAGPAKSAGDAAEALTVGVVN